MKAKAAGPKHSVHLSVDCLLMRYVFKHVGRKDHIKRRIWKRDSAPIVLGDLGESIATIQSPSNFNACCGLAHLTEHEKLGAGAAADFEKVLARK